MKSKKETLKLLATTAHNMAEQDMPLSKGQIDWFLSGCIVALRKLGVQLADVEKTWQLDQAMESQEKL